MVMGEIPELLGRTLIVVAHPDDETVGCGILLQRINGPIVVFLTDGAPRDEYFWGKYGSRLRYQRTREEEARNALGMIGVSEIEFLGAEPLQDGEGIADQELHLHLAEAYERVANLVERHRPDAVLTLSYEGGHPDHDCCGMLAARLHEQFNLPAWEFPLYYRAAGGDFVRQQFVFAGEERECSIRGSSEEIANKRAMLQAYSSQHPFLFEFNPGTERFRPQDAYDYSRPPREGSLNYEAWGWRIRGLDVCAAYGNFAAGRPTPTK
jgi:N-acetylglucosamine malate deacetylase 2